MEEHKHCGTKTWGETDIKEHKYCGTQTWRDMDTMDHKVKHAHERTHTSSNIHFEGLDVLEHTHGGTYMFWNIHMVRHT